jgi:hypothetical protein
VATDTVTHWRKTLGVEGLTGTEGTRRLVQTGQERGVAKLRDKPRSPAPVERRGQTARAPDLAQDSKPGPGAGWTVGQLHLLGIHRDDRVAALTGRSANAVRVMPRKLGIPSPSGPGWTAKELALLRQCNDPLRYVERLGYTRAPSPSGTSTAARRPWPRWWRPSAPARTIHWSR